MIDAALHARACALPGDENAKRWGHEAWAQLGYDVAATGIAHYTLAVRELWPGQRPPGEAMDAFRSGFAAYRHGWRPPALFAATTPKPPIIAG
jgi:hypothetical protein